MPLKKTIKSLSFPEWAAPLLCGLIICVKFIAVDYAVASALNWPLMGLTSAAPLRAFLRAASVSLPSLAAVLCLLIPLMLLPRRVRMKALIAADILLSVLIVTDKLYIRYYSDIFIFHDITLISQTGLIIKSILALFRPWDILLFADIPVIAWLIKKQKISFTAPVKGQRKGAAVLAAVFVLSAAVQAGAVWNIKAHRPNIINAMYDRLSVCVWTGSALFHWWDVYDLAAKALRPSYVTPDTIAEIKHWYAERIPPSSVSTKARSLILIQSESLQYFVIDMKIGGVPVAPNLSRFKNECLYYANTWSQAAGGNSSDAEFMVNTGLYPAPFGAAYSLYDNDDFNSLARAMRKKRGARAIVVQGTKSSFWNCHRMHPKLWFNKQYSQTTYPNDEAIGLGMSDKAIFGRALELLDGMKGPSYCFIVTLTSHHPFDFDGIPKDSLPLPDELKGTLIGNYLLSINYFDKQFGMFIDGLRARGLLDSTLIAVYGDHPAIPSVCREDMTRLLGLNLDEPWMWKKTRRIPLLFRVPELSGKPGTIYTDAGQMDILPTVSGLMGLGITTGFGRDLLNEKTKEPVVFRNGSYIIDGVFVEPSAGRATDLNTGQRSSDTQYRALTEEAAAELKYSDLISENNLIEKIIK